MTGGSHLCVFPNAALYERLEKGEVVHFPECPFALPGEDERRFLFAQKLSQIHKNISLNPHTNRLTGFRQTSPEQASRLKNLLSQFGQSATDWLSGLLPNYAFSWERDRVSFRPEEEATRPLRPHARNDLLHVDAFPTRPTFGARILRLFVNINEEDPRVWVTSDTFSVLLKKFAAQVDTLGKRGWNDRLGSLVSLGKKGRSDYDHFMLRFHHFLKSQDKFQERARKRFWKFPPFSVWLAFSDGVSHAVLRGQYALEHSFFVPVQTLHYPEWAPVNLLKKPPMVSHSRAA